jgi:methionine synthase II (cobalamin-independent)
LIGSNWTEGYPTRRQFLEALIPIFKAEVKELMELDIAVLQFDDPGLCLLVDERFRANYKSRWTRRIANSKP